MPETVARELPDIRDPETDRLLLPRSPLIPPPPRHGDPEIWERLIAAGMVSPPDPDDLVTPRLRIRWLPAAHGRVHWHGKITQIDTSAAKPSTTRTTYPVAGGPMPEAEWARGVTVLREPVEALVWLNAQLSALFARAGKPDELPDGDKLWASNEARLAALNRGTSTGANACVGAGMWLPEVWLLAATAKPTVLGQHACTVH